MEDYHLSRNVHRITLYNTVAAEHRHVSNRRSRLYLHLDMNCFYAQVEQQCYNLYGIPVIVGGWRKADGTPRGIVATSSYEARKLGIKTGMSHLEATQLCPYVVPLQVHYEKYQSIGREIQLILKDFAPEVEAYSMDESFLDVSYLNNRSRHEIEDFAAGLKNTPYRKTRLNCSLGIARSKTYATLASNLQKPNGLTLVLDEAETAEKIHPLSLNEVWGIGSRRYARLEAAGLKTIAEAVEKGPAPFRKLFGAYFGQMLYETVTGGDCARVMDNFEHVPRQIGYMHTFSDWTDEPERVRGEMVKAVRVVCYRMRGYRRKASHFSCYLRLQDITWRGIHIEFSTPGPTNLDTLILSSCLRHAMPAVEKLLQEGHTLRGIGISTQDMKASLQLELFFREDEKLRSLYIAVDRINNRYGLETLKPLATGHAVEGNTHFLERSAG